MKKTIPIFVALLLATRVIHTITTPFTVGYFLTPVVISNLGIAVLNLVTLWVIYNNRDQLAMKQI
jgi:low affinity Fe/Cu permease